MTGYEHEHHFELFGTEVRLHIGPACEEGTPPPELAALEVEAFLRGFHNKLTRFEASSELSKLNSDPASEFAASPLLALAARAAIWAAAETDGLVDPTLVGELEQIGYAHSRAGLAPASLRDALEAAPPRRAAQPNPRSRWRELSVDQQAGIVRRPAGVRIDSGGIGKGLAADLAAGRLGGYTIYAVDAGGDIRIGGADPVPRRVEVENPLGDESLLEFELDDGAIATSGLATRIWRQGERYYHHLIDPSSGEPAWTGVIQATALGPTALIAETIAKAALLSGPEKGRELLADNGGILVLDDGTFVPVGMPSAETLGVLA